MKMPERTFSGSWRYHGEYDYGYQGKERQDIIFDNANAYDFGARILDPRLGRWFSRDPMEVMSPSMSPYNSMGCNPVMMVDSDGMAIEEYDYLGLYFESQNINTFISRLNSVFLKKEMSNIGYAAAYSAMRDGIDRIIANQQNIRLKEYYTLTNDDLVFLENQYNLYGLLQREFQHAANNE